MKNKEKNAFVLAAMTVLNWSERVLAFHHLAPERPAPMDCEPYIQAMILLCREQRLDDDPIKHLRFRKPPLKLGRKNPQHMKEAVYPELGFLDHPKREKDFPIKFVQNLREAGVNRGEAANQPFVAGEMFETRARAGE
jgi:hypothetical protein